jgi:hypothetical protein
MNAMNQDGLRVYVLLRLVHLVHRREFSFLSGLLFTIAVLSVPCMRHRSEDRRKGPQHGQLSEGREFLASTVNYLLKHKLDLLLTVSAGPSLSFGGL